MVGFNKHDTLPSHQKFIAGCASGVATRFMTQPLDVVKLRLQVLKLGDEAHTKNLWLRTAKHIIRKEGITGLFYGHNLGQIYSVLAVSSQFYAYEAATEYVGKHTEKGKLRNALTFCSGIFAGCASATVASPIEVVRVRQMIGSQQYHGMVSSFAAVYRTGGLLAFYQGLSASMLMLGPQVGISFSVFSFFQPRILKYMNDCGDKRTVYEGHPGNIHKPESVLLASSVAGCLAGLVSKTVTYPLDLMKKRMQIGTHRPTKQEKRRNVRHSVTMIKCNKLLDCLLSTVKYDGFLGLYRGWMITIIKAQITNVVAFTTYELVCYFFRDRV